MSTNEIVKVGVSVPKRELDAMKKETRVDLSGPAVLSMARKGMESVVKSPSK